MDWYCVNIEICTKLMRCNIFKYINSFLLYQMVYLHVKLTVNKLYINKESILITKLHLMFDLYINISLILSNNFVIHSLLWNFSLAIYEIISKHLDTNESINTQ